MRYSTSVLAFVLVACGGGQPAKSPAGSEPGGSPAAEAGDPTPSSEGAPSSGGDLGGGEAADVGGDEAAAAGGSGPKEFKTVDTHTAKQTHGVKKSTLKPTKTEAHLKFVVVDKDKGPIPGIVITLTGPDGKTYYADATDAVGFSEVLVPNGQQYEVTYLSLGSKDVAAKVDVEDEANLTMKLTLRYKAYRPVRSGKSSPPRFVLEGVHFDSGKAKIRPDSFPKLDNVVEYMEHNKSARIQISGHTDNVGNKQNNKALSKKRAEACRDYLIKKGIDGSRIEAVGYGDEQPIASNDTPEGRQKNRRIEATEL